MNPMNAERRYDIDWLRVIAIGLLLIYHVAIVFQPWAMFLGFIRSEEAMTGLWKPMTLLNVWRIPLLFYVSGMGVFFALRKRSAGKLLLERSQRILLPFLFGTVAMVPLHFLIFQKFYHLPLGYAAHPGHLWFLGNIFLYVLLFLPLFSFLKKHENGRFRKGLEGWMGNPGGPFSVSLFFVLEALLVKPQAFEMYALTWHGFFLGLLAFLFGFLFMYGGKAFWPTVRRWRWLYLGIATALYVLRLTVFKLQAPSVSSRSNPPHGSRGLWIWNAIFEQDEPCVVLPESGRVSGLHPPHGGAVCRCLAASAFEHAGRSHIRLPSPVHLCRVFPAL
ncbi:MAG: acyltransferase family protein [Bacteroidales bacterium]